MSLNNETLYGLASSLCDLLKSEYGENAFINFTKITKMCKTDHFAQLLLSRATNTPEKVKLFFMTYLICTDRYQKEKIISLSKNLYLNIISFYEDDEEIVTECGNCDDGFIDCSDCDGTGNVDCRYCDGDGKVECDGCSGEGTEECRYCDGTGKETETEEDDEGDEVEVEVDCTVCGGDGTENCRDCGGQGDFECSECLGKGRETCGTCDGGGNEICDWCDGSGEEHTGDYRYIVNRVWYVTLGNKLSQYEGETLTLGDFNEIDNDIEKVPISFSVKSYRFSDDENVTKEDRQHSVGLDDDFVEIVDTFKLENFTYDLNF
jgi:hypothetical protein